MKAKHFVVLESVFLGLGLLAFTPAVNPTGKPSNPLQRNIVRNSPAQKTSGSAQLKPIAVWECTTSWYGEDFDGQPTATGETYDMYGETAAHPTLPLGSIVRVVKPKDHRSQGVRINDRGPYIQVRELDVSYQVARQLGFDHRGLAQVRLELLKVPSRPAEHHD